MPDTTTFPAMRDVVATDDTIGAHTPIVARYAAERLAFLRLFVGDPTGLHLEPPPSYDRVEQLRATLYELGGMSVIA